MLVLVTRRNPGPGYALIICCTEYSYGWKILVDSGAMRSC